MVLLNSDALVFGDWLARLRAAAAEPDVASVTPMTNSGTLCSYPIADRDNAAPLELPFDLLDRMAAEVNRGEVVEVPTGVGFCMLMTRRAIARVGMLDEATFGAGYGEECDWCARAHRAGYRSLAAADTLVLHMAGTSFGPERAARMRAADAVLERRWPSYPSRVAAFKAADPLGPARGRLDAARMRRGLTGRSVLLVTHRRGGGVEQCVQRAAAAHRAAGRDVFRLTADPDGRPVVSREGCGPLSRPAATSWRELAATLPEWGVSSAQVHSLADFRADAPDRLASLLPGAAVPFEMHLHDYLPLCPRINLVDEGGLYCGEPDEAGCDACLAARGSSFGAPGIVAWREAHRRLLAAAAVVVAPDEDAARRYRRRWPEIEVRVRPHEVVAQPGLPAGWSRREGEVFRIAAIGAITRIKGLEVLRACARTARAEGLPLEFHVVGTTSNDAVSARAGLRLAGPYTNDRVQDVLETTGAHAVMIPSTWPETFAFTMSHALASGLPLIVFDLGAQASRLPDDPRNLALPVDLAGRPQEICRRLLAHLEGLEVATCEDAHRDRRGRAMVPNTIAAREATARRVPVDGPAPSPQTLRHSRASFTR